ncbi:LRR receptor-like serine/threonine-protein kinase EFR [Cryptomeria japonica]|uniref:LRR receptor-like serine/threonine-protein kinase EFR n=1 Tax=Cryptomeria japonica TaxID=3369 RepID=UPI0027DAB041|nr:LRR receptor-like serine/threonine-protein kinase EFR [Cryptomeria japonica]
MIDFSNNSLTGSIPISLANCSSLEILNLASNSLYDTVPAELGSLTRVQELWFTNNSLGGSIYFFLNYTELELLALGTNKFEGTIPEVIGYKLPKLQQMELLDNQLSGNIPKSLGNCSALDFLTINYNKLSGAIPRELAMLTGLQTLDLGDNKLRGAIPRELLNFTQLQWLGLANNRFVGSIPADIGLKLPNLQIFAAGGNQFRGGIPKSLGNCSQLSILDLPLNQLSGAVPQELGMLTALQILNLGSNSLSNGHCATMCVLDVFSNCSILEELELQENNFSGNLSSGIGNLSPRLSTLYLAVNNITGSIPEEISNLTELTNFDLSYNNIIGQVPNSLGLLKNLQMLGLSSNKLQGTIPLGFSMLVNLEYLWFGLNHISGEIPSSLGSLQQLRELYLSQNELTGRIPNAIGQCFRLEKIDLSYNSLTGSIPMEISSLHSLVFYLNFSHNSLTGKLPSLGGMQQIQAIDISANKLTGPIPGDIGSCSGLQYLNLSKNKMEGMVPITIGQLKSLESIDISFNELSGPVPPSIANLTMLRHLNFSYNNLNGSVPDQGAFRNLSATSFLANPGLCAASGWLNLRNCTSSAQKHDALSRNIILGASIGTVFTLCCILGAFYIFYRRLKRAPLTDILLGQGFLQISSQELHTATRGFSAANLLGNGSFGSVYKGLLSDNKLVAIKLFDHDPQNSYKHFIRECRVLRKIRHRNLVKVLSSSSAGDFRALVLEFMSQGSLEQHLHRDETQSSLSLKMRVNIALDVAHGMAYLHHDCSPPIVHCDLKPSNVLMDETMTAHVADFGISRLLTSHVSASSSTSRLKGTVGYLAPEYGLGGEVSTKGDVYSFGMLMLEMVTRKRPTDDMFSGDHTLPRWVRSAFPEALEEVVDRELLVDRQTVGESSSATPKTTGEELESSQHGSCLVSLIGLGLQCTRENPADRPTMREVEVMLENMVYGRTYGNLKEHSSIQNLLSVGYRAGHPNGSTDESDSS